MLVCIVDVDCDLVEFWGCHDNLCSMVIMDSHIAKFGTLCTSYYTALMQLCNTVAFSIITCKKYLEYSSIHICRVKPKQTCN